MFNIKTIEEFEKLSKKVKWQYFERLVAFIFDKNGFDTEQNVVLVSKGDKKRQYDVVAKRFGITFVVECKKWKAGKKPQIKGAVVQHKERCRFFAQKLKKKTTPLLVTLAEEDIVQHENVFVVPISKLNWFLNNL